MQEAHDGIVGIAQTKDATCSERASPGQLIAAKSVERLARQIGETQKRRARSVAGSADLGPRAGSGLRPVCEALRCSSG